MSACDVKQVITVFATAFTDWLEIVPTERPHIPNGTRYANGRSDNVVLMDNDSAHEVTGAKEAMEQLV